MLASYSNYADRYYSDCCPHCLHVSAVFPCVACGWQEGQNNDHPFLPQGTVLDDHYRIARVLGDGGFGVTYLAWEENLQFRVAIKEYFYRDAATRAADGLNLEVYPEPLQKMFYHGLDRFLDEARLLAQFDRHPSIISVKGFFRANGTGYMVMEYIEGITMREFLEQCPDNRTTFDQAIKLLTPVMDALQAMHEGGLLHRDVTPANIYITKEQQVKLLDFGAARFYTGGNGKSLSVLLKHGYSPEEQYRNHGKQGAWTDLYSVAATIYRSITGMVPDNAMDRVEHDNLAPPSLYGIDLSPEQEAILLKALAVKADDRFQSIAKFQQALQQSSPQSSSLINNVQSVAGVSQEKRVLTKDKTTPSRDDKQWTKPYPSVVPAPARERTQDNNHAVPAWPKTTPNLRVPTIRPKTTPNVRIPTVRPKTTPNVITPSPSHLPMTGEGGLRTTMTAPLPLSGEGVETLSTPVPKLVELLHEKVTFETKSTWATQLQVGSHTPPPVDLPPAPIISPSPDRVRGPGGGVEVQAPYPDQGRGAGGGVFVDFPTGRKRILPTFVLSIFLVTSSVAATLYLSNKTADVRKQLTKLFNVQPIRDTISSPLTMPMETARVKPIPVEVSKPAEVLVDIPVIASKPAEVLVDTPIVTSKPAEVVTDIPVVATKTVTTTESPVATTVATMPSQAEVATATLKPIEVVNTVSSPTPVGEIAHKTTQPAEVAATVLNPTSISAALPSAGNVITFTISPNNAITVTIGSSGNVATTPNQANVIAAIPSTAVPDKIAEVAPIIEPVVPDKIAEVAPTIEPVVTDEIVAVAPTTDPVVPDEIVAVAPVTELIVPDEITTKPVKEASEPSEFSPSPVKGSGDGGGVITLTTPTAVKIPEVVTVANPAPATYLLLPPFVTGAELIGKDLANSTTGKTAGVSPSLARNITTPLLTVLGKSSASNIVPSTAKPVKVASLAPTPFIKVAAVAPTPVKIATAAVIPKPVKVAAVAPVKIVAAAVPKPIKVAAVAPAPVKIAAAVPKPIKVAAVAPTPVKIATVVPKPVKVAALAPTPFIKVAAVAPTPVKIAPATVVPNPIKVAAIAPKSVKIATVIPKSVNISAVAPIPAKIIVTPPPVIPTTVAAATPRPVKSNFAVPVAISAAAMASVLPISAAVAAPPAQKIEDIIAAFPPNEAAHDREAHESNLQSNREEQQERKESAAADREIQDHEIKPTTLEHMENPLHAVNRELKGIFAYNKPVRVGALMTKQEKMEYRYAMQTARTAESQQQIRELTYARLGQRAREQGMLVVMSLNTAHTASKEPNAHIHESGQHEPMDPVTRELSWTFAYKKPVPVEKLMTKLERREYKQAMHMAKTVESRQQIRELTYARLSFRARERGMLVVIPTSPAHTQHGELASSQIHEPARMEPMHTAPNHTTHTKPLVTMHRLANIHSHPYAPPPHH